MKTCPKCGKEKPLEGFHKSKEKKSGVRSECKECHNHYNRNWHKENPDKSARYTRKWTYGLSHEDYARKLEAQDYKCDCCNEPLDMENKRRVHTDHNHETGQVRGILCQPCNLMIGHAKECADRLTAGASYLKAYQEVSIC